MPSLNVSAKHVALLQDLIKKKRHVLGFQLTRIAPPLNFYTFLYLHETGLTLFHNPCPNTEATDLLL